MQEQDGLDTVQAAVAEVWWEHSSAGVLFEAVRQ